MNPKTLPCCRARAVRTWLLCGVTILSVSICPPGSAEPYRDPQNRFTLDLPEGWVLKKQQLDLVFHFGPKDGPACCLVTCNPGIRDRAKLFAQVVENATETGYTEPPPQSVADMTLNGLPARLAEYESTLESFKMHLFLGGVASQEDDLGIGFLVFMSAGNFQKQGEAIRACFESLRLGKRPKSGVSEVAPVKGSLVKPKAPSTASSFAHELISLTLPAGWQAEKSKAKMAIAKVSHEKHGTIIVAGAPKNALAKKRDEIIEALSSQVTASMPLMKETRGNWEVKTAGCGSAALVQYEGAITAVGEDIPQGVIVAAVKDAKRGIGFMALFRREVKETAVKDILSIIESAR